MSEEYSDLVNELTKRLYNTPLCEDLFEAAIKDLHSSVITHNNLKVVLFDRFLTQGFEKTIRNSVHNELSKLYLSRHVLVNPDAHNFNPDYHCYLAKAQEGWERRMIQSLNTMCTDLNLPLARKRSDKDANDFRDKWTELSNLNKDVSSIRPIYAPKDFLEELVKIRNLNCRLATQGEQSLLLNSNGLLQIPLQVKDVHDLRILFRDLSISQSQNGVDDVDMPVEVFEQDREKAAKKVLQEGNSASCQEFCKRGCPLSLRGKIWTTVLNINLTDMDRIYYNQLKQSIFEHDLLVDTLYFKEVKLTASNDETYFVFEDYLYQMLLLFSRDTRVLQHFQYSTAKPPKTYIKGKLGLEEYAVTYPPSGVIPFLGFSSYVAPLCYLFDDPILLYYTFRELYTRYFYKLHSISSDPHGIFGLSFLFENLLQSHEPELFHYLKSIGVQPLRLVFKWFMRAFSGFLGANQVLLLWDRILAYESLEILAVLAVAIFRFRKTNLLQVKTSNAAEAVLADLTTLQVIPLLQLTLFAV